MLPEDLDFNDLRFCLDNYEAEKIFIRDCGGYREDGEYHLEGKTKVSLELEGRKLDFRKNETGLHILVDSDGVFNFPLKDIGTRLNTGFTIAYERFDESDRRIFLTHGINPYDPNLPEPKSSFLRNIIDKHLMEIYFKGRINLQFHSWFQQPHWKIWTIEKATFINKVNS